MTNMGISYLSYLETVRTNQSRERETHRANVAQETLTAARDAETARSNKAREAETHRTNLVNEELTRKRDTETKRANLAREAETHRSNLTNEAETHRANVARETETNRSNLANEGIKRDTNQQTIDRDAETKRHNIAVETETNRKNTIDALDGTGINFKLNAGVAGLGINVTGAAGYAAATDAALKDILLAQEKAKQDRISAANKKRILSQQGQALIGTTYDSDESAITAITSIPSEQRLNLKLTRDRNKKWKIIQNPSIDPKTGKIKTK